MLKSERDIKAQFNRDTGRVNDGLTITYNTRIDRIIAPNDVIIDRQFYEYLINKIIDNDKTRN